MNESSLSNAIHVCIATGQNAANLIPLKQLNAQNVLILETGAMKRQKSAMKLKDALKPYCQKIDILPFDDSTPEEIVRSAEKLVEDRLDGLPVVFHITGGTKLMVLAIQEQFRMLEAGSGSFTMVYTGRDSLDWYTPPSETQRQPLQDVLTLQDQLVVQGYRIANDTRTQTGLGRARQRSDMSNRLADAGVKLKGELTVLATLANQAEKGRLTQNLTDRHSQKFEELMEYAQKKGLLFWHANQAQLEFIDKESASYFAGGWLEEWVFLKMSGVFGGQEDCYALDCGIKSSKTDVPNQIDAIAVCKNRTLLVECKTGRQKNDGPRDALYKLSKLVNDIGGATGKAIYVSAQLVDDTHKIRAKDYGIEVFDGEDIWQLADFLRNWKNNA